MGGTRDENVLGGARERAVDEKLVSWRENEIELFREEQVPLWPFSESGTAQKGGERVRRRFCFRRGLCLLQIFYSFRVANLE